MSLQNWKTQLRKGLLELCVLNAVRDRTYHGYDLVQELKRIDGLAMREGTVYPILARLEEDGLVTGEVSPSQTGPVRRYYRITRAGRRAVEQMNQHWDVVELAVRQARERRSEAEQ